MRNSAVLLSIILLIFSSCKNSSSKLKSEPWSAEQLMKPEDLAKILNSPNTAQPLIYNIGSAGPIKNSIDINAVNEKKNFEKFKESVVGLSRDTQIVIYCGCCPFKDCPNVRPAFKLLNELQFTNHKLLDIIENLKVDWINKGFPLKE